jgi:Cdc6-like AAA superfamily ATPase
MTALKTLIAKNYFEDDAAEQVIEIVTSLEKQKQVTSQKKEKNNSCGKKQCTLDFFC